MRNLEYVTTKTLADTTRELNSNLKLVAFTGNYTDLKSKPDNLLNKIPIIEDSAKRAWKDPIYANLTPFFSEPLTSDYWHSASVDSVFPGVTTLTDGWAHINASSSNIILCPAPLAFDWTTEDSVGYSGAYLLIEVNNIIGFSNLSITFERKNSDLSQMTGAKKKDLIITLDKFTNNTYWKFLSSNNIAYDRLLKMTISSGEYNEGDSLDIRLSLYAAYEGIEQCEYSTYDDSTPLSTKTEIKRLKSLYSQLTTS